MCRVSGSESDIYLEKKTVQRNLNRKNTAAATGQKTLVTWPHDDVCTQAPGTAGATAKAPPFW